jgi:hypothetical protein
MRDAARANAMRVFIGSSVDAHDRKIASVERVREEPEKRERKRATLAAGSDSTV